MATTGNRRATSSGSRRKLPPTPERSYSNSNKLVNNSSNSIGSIKAHHTGTASHGDYNKRFIVPPSPEEFESRKSSKATSSASVQINTNESRDDDNGSTTVQSIRNEINSKRRSSTRSVSSKRRDEMSRDSGSRKSNMHAAFEMAPDEVNEKPVEEIVIHSGSMNSVERNGTINEEVTNKDATKKVTTKDETKADGVEEKNTRTGSSLTHDAVSLPSSPCSVILPPKTSASIKQSHLTPTDSIASHSLTNDSISTIKLVDGNDLCTPGASDNTLLPSSSRSAVAHIDSNSPAVIQEDEFTSVKNVGRVSPRSINRKKQNKLDVLIEEALEDYHQSKNEDKNYDDLELESTPTDELGDDTSESLKDSYGDDVKCARDEYQRGRLQDYQLGRLQAKINWRRESSSEAMDEEEIPTRKNLRASRIKTVRNLYVSPTPTQVYEIKSKLSSMSSSNASKFSQNGTPSIARASLIASESSMSSGNEELSEYRAKLFKKMLRLLDEVSPQAQTNDSGNTLDSAQSKHSSRGDLSVATPKERELIQKLTEEEMSRILLELKPSRRTDAGKQTIEMDCVSAHDGKSPPEDIDLPMALTSKFSDITSPTCQDGSEYFHYTSGHSVSEVDMPAPRPMLPPASANSFQKKKIPPPARASMSLASTKESLLPVHENTKSNKNANANNLSNDNRPDCTVMEKKGEIESSFHNEDDYSKNKSISENMCDDEKYFDVSPPQQDNIPSSSQESHEPETSNMNDDVGVPITSFFDDADQPADEIRLNTAEKDRKTRKETRRKKQEVAKQRLLVTSREAAQKALKQACAMEEDYFHDLILKAVATAEEMQRHDDDVIAEATSLLDLECGEMKLKTEECSLDNSEVLHQSDTDKTEDINVLPADEFSINRDETADVPSLDNETEGMISHVMSPFLDAKLQASPQEPCGCIIQ